MENIAEYEDLFPGLVVASFLLCYDGQPTQAWIIFLDLNYWRPYLVNCYSKL
jgi:hypothetical protein